MTELTTLVRPALVEGRGGDLLDIRGLRVDFPDLPGAPAIDGMELVGGPWEIVALVGESGSGKSLTAFDGGGPAAAGCGGDRLRGDAG